MDSADDPRESAAPHPEQGRETRDPPQGAPPAPEQDDRTTSPIQSPEGERGAEADL